MKGLLAILFLAAQAQAATLYVSPGGSHSTPFSTWEAAATNIQSAIDAASAGDTVRVAPGTYPAEVTINKNSLTVQGGNGTLWDADRTFIDRQGAAYSVGVRFIGATNSTLRGFTVMGATSRAIHILGASNEVSACVIRGNAGSGGIVRNEAFSANLRFSIVVGNSGGGPQPEAVRDHLDGQLTMVGCVVEANDLLQLSRVGLVRNSVFGNVFVGVSGNPSPGLGGNITSNTTNSVMRLLNIAPASIGTGSNLQWAGVAAYIPRLGSLAQGAGVGYPGIDAAKSGDGGPALGPMGAEFLGRDSSTNANHGLPIGGVTTSTNSPFAGGGSAAFDGNADSYIYLGNDLNIGTNDFTAEAWFRVNALSGGVQGVLGKSRNGPGSGRWALYLLKTGKIRFLVQYDDTTVTVDSTAGLSTGTWMHAAAVWDRDAGITIYVNGVSNAFSAASNATDLVYNYPVTIGRYDTLYPLLGEVADARVWNVARTPEEIAANYTNRLTGTEAGLVGYWRLDETDTPITTGPFNLRNPTLQPTFMEAF